MTNPDILIGSTSGWVTRGSSYNWFDKKTVWGGLEFRTADNVSSRNIFDYLTENGSNRVMTGSATFSNPGRNA